MEPVPEPIPRNRFFGTPSQEQALSISGTRKGGVTNDTGAHEQGDCKITGVVMSEGGLQRLVKMVTGCVVMAQQDNVTEPRDISI